MLDLRWHGGDKDVGTARLGACTCSRKVIVEVNILCTWQAVGRNNVGVVVGRAKRTPDGVNGQREGCGAAVGRNVLV